MRRDIGKPKDWWGDSANAEAWIRQNSRKSENKHGDTVQSTKIFLEEVERHFAGKGPVKILEVGSGDGRLIGPLSANPNFLCAAQDVNRGLLDHVHKTYPAVIPFHSEILKIPFGDKSFDLVYTFQVLQHVHPDEIRPAINELLRVGKEVWMWEGIGRYECLHGTMTSDAHNGSWVYFINQMIDCYEVMTPKNNVVKFNRERLYKFRS